MQSFINTGMIQRFQQTVIEVFENQKIIHNAVAILV